MMEHENIENGLLTRVMNTAEQAFQDVEQCLAKEINALSDSDKINIELRSMKIKIEDYLKATNDEVITVGDFLRQYIDKLNLRQNKLADYIGLNPSNFNKILSGNRKVNFELSYILSQIFGLSPDTFILVQVKNDYIELTKNKAQHFQKFKLEDLIRA